MQCPSCAAEIADDSESCFLCGWEDGEFRIVTRGWTPGPLPNAEHFQRMEARRAGYVVYAEGRSLESAGDIVGALRCYESLVASGFDIHFPYERLAIMYRKSRRPEDEERVVRAAIAAIGRSHRQPWFSERLAKLMVRRGLRELTSPPPPKGTG